MMGFVMATQEDFGKLEIGVVGERSFDVETPAGIQALFIKHIEVEPAKIIEMHRAAPSIEWLTVQEMEQFAVIYGESE